MTVLSTFFKGSDTHFGVFFPKKYLLAVFPDLEAAREAERRVLDGGFAHEDVLAVPGEEVVHLAEEHLQKRGLWKKLMQELSRFIGTEEVYAIRDLELARQGAAFLAVYCPNEQSKREAWKLIEPCAPMAARHYGQGGIDHLAGETNIG